MCISRKFELYNLTPLLHISTMDYRILLYQLIRGVGGDLIYTNLTASTVQQSVVVKKVKCILVSSEMYISMYCFQFFRGSRRSLETDGRSRIPCLHQQLTGICTVSQSSYEVRIHISGSTDLIPSETFSIFENLNAIILNKIVVQSMFRLDRGKLKIARTKPKLKPKRIKKCLYNNSAHTIH